LQSTNDTLRERVLPALLRADIAGASGLSNAVKFLSKIEPLQMTARALDGHADAWRLNGALPWITNLRKEGFLVAVAADHDELRGPSIFAVPHDVPGVVRGADLDLIAMRASNTASLQLEGAVLDKTWQIAVNGPDFIAAVRPAFLGLQCGMSIGLARRALSTIDQCGPASRAALADDATGLWKELNALSTTLFNGILDGTFVHAPARAFEVRIRLAALVDAALTLEVQASGGRGYLRAHAGTARRSRESCFIPIITPSVIQLRGQLAQYRDGGTGGTS
jgi:alkylation response protein AidB-like acyl-CoA dehydrogenase